MNDPKQRLIYNDFADCCSVSGFFLTEYLNLKLENNPNMNFSECLTQVQKENPDLAAQFVKDLRRKLKRK